MQKYEADIRQHISIEQQLQIYIDSLKQKMEDMEGEQTALQAANMELLVQIEKKEMENEAQAERLAGKEEAIEALTKQLTQSKEEIERL